MNGNNQLTDELFTGKFEFGYCVGHLVRGYIRREPDRAAAPDEFSVNVYVTDPDGNSVDIVRIDTQADVGVHIDRLYLPETDKRRHHDPHITTGDSPIVTPDEARDWLIENRRWRDFVELYDDNHGLPPTSTSQL